MRCKSGHADASMWRPETREAKGSKPQMSQRWSQGGGNQAAGSERAEDRTRRGKGPQSHGERRARTLGVGRKRELSWILGRRKERAELLGSKGGWGWSPERRGPGSPAAAAAAAGWGPAGAGRGRIRRAACCAAPGISVPSPRGRLIPHPQVTSAHDLSPRCRDTVSARVAPPWLCSRDPSVPPARLHAYRACALRSRLLSSAEAAAASLFRSHGVSNRSSLLLQLPFPPFRSSRPSRLGRRREGGASVRDHGRAGAEEGTRASARCRACALGPMVGKGGGGSYRECWRLKTAHVRLHRRTSLQREFYFVILERICPGAVAHAH